MNANELREVLNSHRELTLKAHRFEQARDKAAHETEVERARMTALISSLLGIGFSGLAIERLAKRLPLTRTDRELIAHRMTQPEEA